MSISDVSDADGAHRMTDAQRRSFNACWSHMALADLHGYPLWEQGLKDVLERVFPELQLIFVHYCGASIQGAASIGNATKIGLQEMLSFEKDVALCTHDFELGALTRLFYVANSEAALRKVAAEKHAKTPPRPASARPSYGKNQSSLSGGIFANVKVETVRPASARVDNNESSIPGGIFGVGPIPGAKPPTSARFKRDRNKSGIPGGIFGSI